MQRWKIPTHVIYSQNARGLKTDSALTEAIDALRRRSGFSAGLQETWRTGLEEIEEDGFVFLGAAPAVQNGRGSKGVGILLSPLAVAAWRAAGAVVHNDVGPRVIAVRMEVEDSAGRKQGLFQVASYAPISTAPDTEKDEYETALACVLSRRPSGNIMIVCADTNASIGRGYLGGLNVGPGAVGPHGIDFLNDSGRRLRSFMELHDLAALSSFFKKPFYGTWLHPCSKLQKQLDHIMISRCDLKRFTDAGACCGQLIDSDHSAVFCKLRFTVRLRRKLEPRAQLARLDTAPLLNQDQAVQFATDVVTSLGTSDASAVSYSTLAKAMEKTAAETLPKRERPAPLWFAAKEGVLRTCIANRNATFNAHQQQPTAETVARYREARSRVQLEIRNAKSDWILGKCTAINDGICGATGSAAAWATVKVLKAGLAPPRRAPPAKMKKADGSLADTPEENASVFADAFSQLYGREASFDPSVLDDLPQRPVAVGLDHVPTDDEIRLATSKLHATAPGPSGLHARLWQALVSTSDGFGFVRNLVQHFWETEELPEGWETGLLSILPKKGDLSLPGNYRGIMMLETAYKIAGNIILVRLKPIKEGGTLNHENQNGFRPNRGCFDAIFSIKTLIKKRREHGLETWLLLIDLVKAFDRVPRELLWRVMLKQGVPPKIVSLLKALHATVKVQFEVGGVKKVIDSIIGVKQGDLLGPELFIFFMAAVMETWRLHHDFELCVVRSKNDFVLTGRRPSTVGDVEFSLRDSMYADDAGLAFCSRRGVEVETPKVVAHFARWGMEIHVGKDGSNGEPRKDSKSEVLFCAAAPTSYNDPATYHGADLSDIKLPGGCFMPVVDRFKYLGSYLNRDCSNGLDVDSRIESAGRAFGALRKCLFSSLHVSFAAKRAVYTSLILSILLYGCECWALTERLLHRLHVFHAQCVRAMCRVTRKHVWEHNITTGELCARLGLDFIDYYIDRRRLGWLGHVSRMDFERLPRRMLSSWVPHGRPIGCPNMTFGRSIRTALDKFHIDRSRWPELAADRSAWRQTLEDRRPPDAFFAMPARTRPPSPRIARTKPVRSCLARTNAAMDISLQALAGP